MNRRNFLGTLVKAFTILPAATTYARRWTTLGSLVVPEYSCVMSVCTPETTLTSEQFYQIMDTAYAIKRNRIASREEHIDCWVPSESYLDFVKQITLVRKA